MKLNVKNYSQRDVRWGSVILGNNTLSKYNLYDYGCLITSLGNYVDKTPAEMNTLLKNNGGFTAGGGNFIWSKCSVLGLKELYVSARCMNIDFYATELQKAKDLIKEGYPLLAEVDFNPATDYPEMHFVLLAGISDNNELLVVDPWEGQWETWSDGASKRNIYQFRQYDKKCLEGEDTSTILVKKKDFENMWRKSTLYDWIISTLKITDSETVVKDTINQSLGYEDTIAKLEKDKRDLGETAKELQGQLIEVKKELEDEKKTNQEHMAILSEEAQKREQRNVALTAKVTELSTALQKLTDQSVKPISKPWWQFWR